MIVICPKCKIKLKADETKLSVEGSRFKCPKCGTVLIVKKPATEIKKTLDKIKYSLLMQIPRFWSRQPLC